MDSRTTCVLKHIFLPELKVIKYWSQTTKSIHACIEFGNYSIHIITCMVLIEGMRWFQNWKLFYNRINIQRVMHRNVKAPVVQISRYETHIRNLTASLWRPITRSFLRGFTKFKRHTVHGQSYYVCAEAHISAWTQSWNIGVCAESGALVFGHIWKCAPKVHVCMWNVKLLHPHNHTHGFAQEKSADSKNENRFTIGSKLGELYVEM